MVAWPSIRKPTRAGWRGVEPDGVRSTSMDAGPNKKRGESSAPGAVEVFRYKLSLAQAGTLRTFYNEHKADRFDYTHPAWNEAVEAAFNAPIAWSEEGPWRIAEVRLEIYPA